MASISESLAQLTANKDAERHSIKRSAVAMVLDSDDLDSASILMIQRASHDSDPWSGHMAFPGGRQEASDENAIATAKREMLEEVGLDIDQQSAHRPQSGLIGRLSDFNASRRAIRRQMVVSPYVFIVDNRPELAPNYEVADTVWIPLSFFADLSNREERAMAPEFTDYKMPCYPYTEDKVVWGMSLAMIEELLVAMGVEVPRWFGQQPRN